MNKKLLTSISLLAAVIAAPSFADYAFVNSGDFKVTIGGNLNLQGGVRFQPSSKTKKSVNGEIVKIGPSANNEDGAFASDAHVYLGASNNTKDGLRYGAQIGVVASTRGGLPSKDILGRTYGFFEHDNWGRVELGTRKGASKVMQIDGDTVASATGGYAGDWGNYMTLTSYNPNSSPTYNTKATNEDNFTKGTKLVVKDPDSKANNEGCRKITYYTPKYNGFQVGLSYIPDEANRATTPLPVTDGPTRKVKNAITAGIVYENQLDKKQSFKIALVGETGEITRSGKDKAEGRTYYKPRAIDLGGTYTYDKISVAASYGNRGKSTFRKQANLKKAIFYTAGAAYKFTDKISSSLTYFHSDNKNKLDIVSIGGDYTWLPGVQSYAEVTHIMAKQKYDYNLVESTAGSGTPSATNFKNKGTVVLVGTRFSL